MSSLGGGPGCEVLTCENQAADEAMDQLDRANPSGTPKRLKSASSSAGQSGGVLEVARDSTTVRLLPVKRLLLEPRGRYKFTDDLICPYHSAESPR